VEAFPQKDDPERRVFPDAKLPTCVYVAQALGETAQFRVRMHPGKDIEPGSPAYVADLGTLRKLDDENLMIPLVDGSGWTLLQGLTTRPWLGKMRDCAGSPASGEIVFNASFREYLTDDPCETLVLRGGHVQRYEIVGDVKQGEPVYIKKAQYLKDAGPGSNAFDHTRPRIVYQECAAIDNWRRIIAAYLPAGTICGHTICYFKECKSDEMALLAVFNSRLMEWLFGALSVTNHLSEYLVGSLPFPRLSGDKETFSLPPLDDLAAGAMAATASRSRGTKREKGPAAGALLCHMAEQMTDLHRQRQAEVKRFLDWLVKQLRITATSDGKEGLDALTGRTRLRSYLGDYQKDEEHLSFEGLLDILQKNRSRIGASLSDPALVSRLRAEHEASLATLLPIKERLAKTDWLIDQVVYRLYGLTEEEIKIVEGER
jgi:hypothetical protein